MPQPRQQTFDKDKLKDGKMKRMVIFNIRDWLVVCSILTPVFIIIAISPWNPFTVNESVAIWLFLVCLVGVLMLWVNHIIKRNTQSQFRTMDIEELEGKMDKGANFYIYGAISLLCVSIGLGIILKKPEDSLLAPLYLLCGILAWQEFVAPHLDDGRLKDKARDEGNNAEVK